MPAPCHAYVDESQGSGRPGKGTASDEWEWRGGSECRSDMNKVLTSVRHGCGCCGMVIREDGSLAVMGIRRGKSS